MLTDKQYSILRNTLPPFLLTVEGKLTKPLQKLLAAAFHFSEKTLSKTTWVYYKSGNFWQRKYARIIGVGKNVNATVISRTVIHDGRESRSFNDWLSLIVHEQVHRQQIDRTGGSWLGSAIVGMKILVEVISGKKAIETSTEKEAYRYGGNWCGRDYTDNLLAYQNGEVIRILKTEELDEEEKAGLLFVLGLRFRKEVLMVKYSVLKK